MKIHTMPQRSPEWHAIRKTVFVTASELAPFFYNKGAVAEKARLNFIAKKLAMPIYEDACLSGYSFLAEMREKEERQFEYNIPVQRGNALEEEARDAFCKAADFEAAEFGFVTDDDGIFGFSPDALIYDPERPGSPPVGGLEIKCPIPETHIKWLLAGGIPDEHRCQVHGSMGCAGLPWFFMSYCPGLPDLIVPVKPDNFTAELQAGIRATHKEYLRIGAKLAGMCDVEGGIV